MSPSRSLPSLPRTASVSLAGLLVLVSTLLSIVVVPAAHADASPVRINEVESSGGTPGDWIELVNPSSASVDLSGYVLKDNDDTHIFTIASGTTIAAGAYAAFDVEPTFGLGSSDSARLYDATGALVDSYTWTAHAATTYGRCPDGTGTFQTTVASTKGAANSCGYTQVRINEVESNGGTPGDWVELYNPTTSTVDVSGLKFKDNDDTHAFYVIPSGTTIAAKGFLVLEEAQFGFGLGTADSARLFAPDGTTIIDSYSWTAHAAITYGRCPDGTGAFTSTGSTKGAANDCGSPVRINEIESDGGTPGDWIELVNPTTAAVDVSGYVLRGAADTPSVTVPASTSIPAGGYLAVDVAPTLDLGAGDAARLFAANGTTLIDSYSWTSHASTTYGRCPDSTGSFTTTQRATKGARNVCPGDLATTPWPGGATVATADTPNAIGGDLSGLTAEPGVLWGVVNGTGSLLRMVPGATAGSWVVDSTTTLKYPDGTGRPDTEGISPTGVAGRFLIATERNNDANTISRPSVLQISTSTLGGTLSATREWNLASSLPTVGANLGLEGVAWVPDSYLTAAGFVDASTGAAYDPSRYPNHGGGVAFVALEANGTVYGYVLQDDGTATKIATVASGSTTIADVVWDPETSSLWTVCDDTCNGVTTRQQVGAGGSFGIVAAYDRPAGMPNLNNEGFALAPQSTCVNGSKTVFWSDDSNTGGNALRTGTITCTAPVASSVSGTVRDANGPISGACVYLYTSRTAPSASYGTCTNADGTFYLGNVAAGTYEVAVADPSGVYSTAWRDTPLAVSGATTGVALALATKAPGRVTGRITEADGTTGVNSVCVFLYPHGVSTAASYATCAQDDGTYGLYGVAAGDYDAAFYDVSGVRTTQWSTGSTGGAATQSGAVAIAVAGATPRVVNAAMSATGMISGRVTDPEGTGIAGVCVYVYASAAGPARNATCTSADGSYWLGGIAAGSSYRVAFSDPQGRFVTQWYSGTTSGAAGYSSAASVGPIGAGVLTTGIGARMARVG
ncbi:hypothetical protein GCM10022215_25510 [Nocardioides fonticola]|uniref:alpha-amylase n=1 Tax=Nocardioides fonticola TaxID=450363 RepID=A0ABP7XKR6_9ACTN